MIDVISLYIRAIKDAINFVSLFEIAQFKEPGKIFIDGIILQHTKWPIEVERVYTTNHKTTRQIDFFKVKKKDVDDI